MRRPSYRTPLRPTWTPLYERIQEAGIEIVTDEDSAQTERDGAGPPSSEELARAFEDPHRGCR